MRQKPYILSNHHISRECNMDEYPDSHLSEDVHKSHHKFCTKCGSDIVKIKRHSFCPGCGAEDEGKKFCPECGTPLHIHQKHEELTENGIEVAPVTKKSIRTEPVVEVEAQAPLQPQMQPISNQYPPASAPASSGYAQQPMQAPAPPQSPPPQVCPLCGNAATYMPQYSQWYCYNCKKYYIPSNPQPAPPPPLQAQQPAQAVPHQQNSYGFGKFVDVVKSLMPSWGEMKSSMEQAAEEEEKTGRPGAAGKAAEENNAAKESKAGEPKIDNYMVQGSEATMMNGEKAQEKKEQ